AVEEGYVAGGGVALLRAAQAAAKKLKELPEEQRQGAQLLCDAASAPLAQIAKNAGLEARVVVETVKAEKGSWGYDAREDRYGDLVEMGILDPVKVVRIALE